MTPAPLPENEAERLARLRSYEILDTPSEASFDRITRIVAETVGVPIALVSLVDGDRQWFKSKYGLDAAQTPRDVAFCAYTILGDDLFVVEDATRDTRFADNPLVTGAPQVRFYAAAPLTAPDGHRIGALCAIDSKPRTLTAAQRALLADLACLVVDEMELRLNVRNLIAAHKEAEKANAAKTEFLASMSHELRTPLNAIIGFAQAIDYGVGEEDPLKRQEMLRHIVEAGNHLNELIGEVLDFARIERGIVDLRPEPVAADEICLDLMPLMRQFCEKNAVKFTHVGHPHDRLLVDRVRFRQILLNLGSNAVKYNRKGGTVTCAFEETAGGRLRISVADTGIGIPAELRDRVFEPFDRLRQHSTDVAGSGVGLSITKKLVEMMGGTIGFESEPGQGSTFWVEFPTHRGEP